ncbi:MAG TPA: hypothetical protein DDW85_03690 [Porphyromonadaceae bacterium]|jgi:C-terminal processing protease CtpA/Prc|nr:hypothetical protein [Porphyromonadaceae bacterium]
MKKIFAFLLGFTVLFSVSCEKKETDLPIYEETSAINQFIYDGMSTVYLWADEMKDKKPTSADTDSKEYFEKLLYTTDTEHGWSWITDDVDALLADFSGEATAAFGFAPYLLWYDQTRTRLVAFVRYVFPGTPAQKAGLVRGDIIDKINSGNITEDNYALLYSTNSETTFTVYDQQYENPKEVTIVPASLDTDPVLADTIYTELGSGKKIGYLFYTNFISEYNDHLYEVFQKFKAEGITHLVLDLRYNTGGDVSAATYLASLIAPKAVVETKPLFTELTYNDFINKIYREKNWNRIYLGSYDNTKERNPLDANPDLDKVYIIATSHSYSASELLTFCLKPYTQVEHIGEKTGGKYTASWTVHAYDSFEKNGNARAVTIYDETELSSKEKDELKNWALQPIVARYTDKNENDFIETDGVIPNYPIESQEYNTETWKRIGDPDDYLLAKAVSLITGKPYADTNTKSARTQFIDAGWVAPSEEVMRESVNLDDIRISLQDIQNIRQQQRNAEQK